ncbi:hypothetical protein WICMUC_002696 [Wickerhamomyces mucosus]|uniref:Uncharacterized protein n=1 Tax=Wickerhamomyces mucosus TaxID=1378264 RepID=A0A9P8PPV1_9ASCO|nr:hypothetical protein WICMUC_002696 [Wickerhamomyces mucosus]
MSVDNNENFVYHGNDLAGDENFPSILHPLSGTDGEPLRITLKDSFSYMVDNSSTTKSQRDLNNSSALNYAALNKIKKTEIGVLKEVNHSHNNKTKERRQNTINRDWQSRDMNESSSLHHNLKEVESRNIKSAEDTSFEQDLGLRRIDESIEKLPGGIDTQDRYTDIQRENVDSERSLLKPYQKYNFVQSPGLGSPLLPNGSPLDFSSVSSKPYNFSPISLSDRRNLSKDELKIYDIWENELNSKIFDSKDGEIKRGESTSFYSLISCWFSSLSSTDHMCDQKETPWYTVKNYIAGSRQKGSCLKDSHRFEQNNSDMLISNGAFSTMSDDIEYKQVITYAISDI